MIYLHESKDVIYSKNFLYLSEALKSRRKYDDKASIMICADLDGEDDKVKAVFNVSNYKKTEKTSEHKVVMQDNEICFDSMVDVELDVPCKLSLGNMRNIIQISDSNIACKSVIFKKNELIMEATAHSNCTIVSEENAVGYINDVIFNGEGDIRISFPNISSFPKLYKNRFDFAGNNSDNIVSFMYQLNRIFLYFRSHSKDTPAKMADKYDRIILKSEFRRDIFNFMLSLGIIYREGHLYKMNIDNLSKENLNWQDLIDMTPSKFEDIYKKYKKWVEK